jgi:hypothetical protein
VNVREPAMMRRMGASLLQRAERAYGVSKKTGFFRDCSGETGLPPTGVDRLVRVLTIEPGGPHHVRSRCVPTRPERREHGAGCLAPACERPLPSQRPPATVPALWSRGLAGPALSADPPGLGESRRMGSARAAGDLGPACLSAGAPVRERRPLRAGPPGPAGEPPGERAGGPPRGRSRCAPLPTWGEAGGNKGTGAPGPSVPGLGLGGFGGVGGGRCALGRPLRSARGGRAAPRQAAPL